MENTKKVSPEQFKIMERQADIALARLKADEFSSLVRLINFRLKGLFDTLKKSDDISTIRWLQGQIAVYEWLINKISS